MYMLEPDWGYWRTLLVFWVAGMSGNFLSSVVDPCKTSVGSSGGLFGLIGGLCAFVIEYWNTIPRPVFFLCFTIGVGLISILTGLTESTDSWAHIGGLCGGALFGFGTITTLRPFLGEKPTQNPSGNMLWRWVKWKCSPRCQCGYQEWILRVVGLGSIIIGWSVLAHFLWDDIYYQSLGSITFKGMEPCCCCYDLKTYSDKNKTSWTCYICDLPYWSNSQQAFGDYCDAQNVNPTSRVLANKLPETRPVAVTNKISLESSADDLPRKKGSLADSMLSTGTGNLLSSNWSAASESTSMPLESVLDGDIVSIFEGSIRKLQQSDGTDEGEGGMKAILEPDNEAGRIDSGLSDLRPYAAPSVRQKLTSNSNSTRVKHFWRAFRL